MGSNRHRKDNIKSQVAHITRIIKKSILRMGGMMNKYMSLTIITKSKKKGQVTVDPIASHH